jgi:hypothetical protein
MASALNTTMSNVTLQKQREELLRALKARFEENMNRHKGLGWAKVQCKQSWKLMLKNGGH